MRLRLRRPGSPDPQEKAQILVALQDTGVGIDPNNVDQPFSAFFSTKRGDMGMGLSINRSFVETHGGRRRASRSEPHGAIFQSPLPVGSALAQASIAPNSRRRSS